jgi:SAM-dependent methyltransferase
MGTILLIQQQVKQFSALNQWFESRLGESVASEFTKQLEPFLDYISGYSLLQLGTCATNPWLDTLKFTKKWIATPVNTTESNTLICSLNQLPIQRNSMDCVIAPLSIEPFENTLNLIDEIDRVLRPTGYVVVLCLNPWSLWGAALHCGLFNCYAEKKLKLQSAFHLNRVFMQRGYRQCALNNFYYMPPVTNHRLLKKNFFFNEVGKMIWPFPSGFYCYIAQKVEIISPTLDRAAVVHAWSKGYDVTLPAINRVSVEPLLL